MIYSLIFTHWSYLKYVLWHKYYVGVECFKEGPWWRGLKHDWHKFLPSEFLPYSNFFYGPNGKNNTIRDKTGYYKPTDTGNKAFDRAWFCHQKRADHHWQWWVMPEDTQGVKILPMSAPAIVEMMSDWCGASRAQGHGGWTSPSGVFAWYATNGHKMQLHPQTRAVIEMALRTKGADSSNTRWGSEKKQD